MTQEEICRNFIARIFTSEYADGNGVIVGNRLITAAHVLENSTSFELSFGKHFFRLPTKSAKDFQLPESREDGKFLDLAVFDLEDPFNSSISFFDGDIDEADVVCYAWRHNCDNNIESWKPFERYTMPLPNMAISLSAWCPNRSFRALAVVRYLPTANSPASCTEAAMRGALASSLPLK